MKNKKLKKFELYKEKEKAWKKVEDRKKDYIWWEDYEEGNTN